MSLGVTYDTGTLIALEQQWIGGIAFLIGVPLLIAGQERSPPSPGSSQSTSSTPFAPPVVLIVGTRDGAPFLGVKARL